MAALISLWDAVGLRMLDNHSTQAITMFIVHRLVVQSAALIAVHGNEWVACRRGCWGSLVGTGWCSMAVLVESQEWWWSPLQREAGGCSVAERLWWLGARLEEFFGLRAASRILGCAGRSSGDHSFRVAWCVKRQLTPFGVGRCALCAVWAACDHRSTQSPFIRSAGLMCYLRLVRINWLVIGWNKLTCNWLTWHWAGTWKGPLIDLHGFWAWPWKGSLVDLWGVPTSLCIVLVINASKNF